MPRKRKLTKVGAADGKITAPVKVSKKLVSSSSSAIGPNDNYEENDVVTVAFNGPATYNQNGGRTDDRQVLLAIFPEEVWLLIFDEIRDPDMLASLSNASPVFREWLLPRRVLFLFPNVWNVLGVKYHREAVQNSDGESKLRMVCKSWRDALDHLYQSDSFRNQMFMDDPRAFENPTDDFKPGDFTTQYFHLNVPNNLELCTSHFASTHSVYDEAIRNPFIGRSVTVFIQGWDADDEEAVQILNRLNALFLTYGRHIWYLHITLKDPFLDKVEGYSTIRSLLQLVPNLKILAVSFEPDDDNIGYNIVPVMGAEEMTRLQAYINLHPLPTLQRLQFLKTTRWPSTDYMPVSILNELTRSNGHVSMMEFDHKHASSIGIYNLSSATLPNLSQLSMTIRSDEDFEAFFARDVQWRLSKLGLDFEGTFSVQWDRIFREVGAKWAETLTALILHLPQVTGTEWQTRLLQDGGNFRLNLPRVTHLKLSMPHLCSLDFLLPMKDSLELLELDVNAIVPRLGPSGLVKRFENGKMVQLLKCANKPMDSNAWTLFPKLKRVLLDYYLACAWEQSKGRRFGAFMNWSVSRHQWQNWDKQANCYRRQMIGYLENSVFKTYLNLN